MRAESRLVLIDANVGSAFVEPCLDAKFPLGQTPEISDALDALTNRHAIYLLFVVEKIIA